MTKKTASKKAEVATHEHKQDHNKDCCNDQHNLCSTKACCNKSYDTGCGSITYFLGVIGSAIYFVSAASGFWAVVLALLKSLVWPVFLVLYTFRFLGM